MKWAKVPHAEAGYYWQSMPRAGEMYVDHAPWLGGWVLVWYPMNRRDDVQIGKAAKSAETCKRRAVKFLREMGERAIADADA
jgi:hypothetical protein